MRAELVKEQQMVAFVWGDERLAMKGQILVYRYDFNQAAGIMRHFDIPTDSAKAYWNILVHNGYHRALLNPEIQS